MQTIESPAATAGHPLEPLSARELAQATSLIKRERALGPSARFVYVSLQEPSKAEVLAFRQGDTIERRVHAVLRDRAARATYEAVVSLSTGRLVSWREVPGVQTAIMPEEFLGVEEAVKKDPRWQEAMRRRGVTDFDLCILDPWSLGYDGPDDHPDRGRFVRPLTWVRTAPGAHTYTRPVENLVVRFDLDRMEVVEVEDHGPVPLPTRHADYDPEGITDPSNVPYFPEGLRTDLKPIEITQPEGRSFTVDGHMVRWQKWSFRIGFTPREGLVLHTIGYQDRGATRPIIYRASLSEMFVPYGDPRPTHYRKNVFDMGEYGIGVLANSLELGCDCLGDIHYFDAVINDNDGNPLEIKNAICMHEEDFGLLWKHTDFRTAQVQVRRSRRLVVSMIATVGNYEYGFFWYFYQDGTIGYEVKLTGVISNGALPEGVKPAHGALVAPGVYGPNHQHFFNVRLDMMVDGPRNSVYECDSEAVPPGPENPHGNAWVVKPRLLASESQAQRIIDPLVGRYWKITNPSSLNGVGEPVAYKLQPGDNVLPFYQPDAHALQRAQFTTRHLWVTAYEPSQLFAAGDYPNQHPGGAGLPAFTADDRSIANTDIVVWYTFGTHHVVRPEDWPVMPVAYAGFHLKPAGFFDGSPALDVPIADRCHHHS